MSKLGSFFKNLPLGRMLALFIAGIALLLTTACNPGNVQGARPNNPPVQMGGNNMPHSMDGDGYTNYKMSTDPSVNKPAKSGGDRADAGPINQLIAANIDSNASDMLYPGSSATNSNNPDIGPRGRAIDSREAGRIPSERQRVIDRSNPDEKILEKIGQQFEDASEFLKDTGKSAAAAPEFQRNPALNR